MLAKKSRLMDFSPVEPFGQEQMHEVDHLC